MDEITHVVNSYYAVIGQKDNDIFELYHDNKRLRMEVEDARGGAEDREAELGTLRLLVAAQQAELREKECLIAAHEDEGAALRMAMQSIRVALDMPSELSHPAAAVAAACVRLCGESRDVCSRLAKAAAERSVCHIVDAEAVARAAHREARDEALEALAHSERSARLALADRLQWRDDAGEFIAQSKQREDEWIAYTKQREDEWTAQSKQREDEWIAQSKQREDEWTAQSKQRGDEWIARNELRETEWIARNELRETEWTARHKLREAALTALAEQCCANRCACTELFVAEARGRADVISAQCADSRRLMFNFLRSAAAATLIGLRAANARANEAERLATAAHNQSQCERRAAVRREAAGREMIAALRAQCDAVRQRAAKRTALTQQRAAAEGQRLRAEIADAQRCAEEAKEEVRRVVEERRQDARLMAEEWARAEQCVKEEKAKAEQRINEEKAKAEQRIIEEKVKAEQRIIEEKAKAEQCVKEEKVKAEQCVKEEKVKAEQCVNEEKAKAEELCARSKASARDAAERLAAEKTAFISELREWSAVLDDARRKVSAAEAERDREREMRGVLLEQHRDEQRVLRRLAEERAAEHKREVEALRENITALEATCRRAAEVIAALREAVHRKDLDMSHPE